MTSPIDEIVVRCSCGRFFQDWYRGSINASLDPEMAADDEYLEEASTARCPACGTKHQLGILIADAETATFDFREPDREQAARVWFDHDPDYEEAKRKIFR